MNDQTGTALLQGNAIKIASGPVVPPDGHTIDHPPYRATPFVISTGRLPRAWHA
jgi:hypothetical protein